MLSTVLAAARVARADLKVIYTPMTWTFGWLGRILAQVIFFAVIGVLLEDPDALVYLFVGQAVMVAVVEVFMSLASTTWERGAGTLPLLIAAPGPLWPVFFGRSLQWIPSGVATSCVALFALGPILGIFWEPGLALLAVPVLLVTVVSMYAMALALAAVVLRAPRWRNVTSNIAHILVMLLCGVTVPAPIWPHWIQMVGQLIPLTHGLEIIRGLQASYLGWDLGTAAVLLVGTGLLWALGAAAAFTLFGEAGRRDGSISFAD
ncbi:ABC transporter permease [Nesterenkonia muleiensis]|uniref:ABC transporter permease n=1 Tax=Nesterenkonia muleiensis TaxID=2282648 RepID=UPI000E74B606|nr:ABC transporter permease [Nesterenkonia muleiensis]